MQEKLFIFYYLILLTGLIIGIRRYRFLDKGMRTLTILLLSTAVFELATYLSFITVNYALRPPIYHLSSVIEIILVSRYFIEQIKPFHYAKLLIINYCAWPALAVLNACFLQPVTRLNTNFLVLESFSIITMSLYSIYLLLKKNLAGNMFSIPGFWISVLWLILWSSTFFFWAFIKVLYNNGWPYMNAVLAMQSIINIIVYAGIATVLFLYPKMKTIEYC
jgi:hypothetical protein